MGKISDVKSSDGGEEDSEAKVIDDSNVRSLNFVAIAVLVAVVVRQEMVMVQNNQQIERERET